MPDPSQPRALIVDDDDTIRNMLSRIVERLDLQVDTARDGAEAIEQLDRDGYAVVVLDLMMPRVDGFAVLRHMQEHQRDLLRCTIIASAVPEPEILRRFGIPVYRMHRKPFDIAALLQDVRECTGKAARAAS